MRRALILNIVCVTKINILLDGIFRDATSDVMSIVFRIILKKIIFFHFIPFRNFRKYIIPK